MISSLTRQKDEFQNVFQENKARQIFRKINISYPLICTMFVFRKIWYALFSWNTRFEIRTFGIFYRRYLFSWKSRQDHICIINILWVLIHSCLRQSLFGKWSFFKYGWNPLELSMKEFVFYEVCYEFCVRGCCHKYSRPTGHVYVCTN